MLTVIIILQLIAALFLILVVLFQSGKVRAAGLDVYVDEPTKNKALYSHPKVSCTPHNGAATVEAQKRIGAEIVEIIKAM